MKKTLTDITCKGCSLLCDDLTITLDQSKRFEFECSTSCPQAFRWLQSSLQVQSKSDSQHLSESIETAKNWLRESQAPLVCGIQGLSLEAEKCLIEFAQKTQAYLSAATSPHKITAYQQHGGSSCTLGEVRHRADFILVGNCDLQTTWHRFDEKLLSQSSRFLSEEKPRELVFLGDASRLENSARYTEVIDVSHDRLADAVILLRRFLQKQNIKTVTQQEPSTQKEDAQLKQETISQLEQLAKNLLDAEYPVLFYDDSLAENSPLWTKLVTEVNQVSRMHSLFVSPGIAKGGASETILAMTGFPDHIAFRDDKILHDIYRYQPTNLIEKQEVDLIFFAGDHIDEKWSKLFQKLSTNTRLIAIHSGITELPKLGVDVQMLEIQTQTPGIHEAGTTLRCDGVPLPLRSITPSSLPTTSEIIRLLLNR